jgi:hypothetical protein
MENQINILLNVPMHRGIAGIGWTSGLPSHAIVGSSQDVYPLIISITIAGKSENHDFTGKKPDSTHNFPNGYILQSMQYLPDTGKVTYNLINDINETQKIIMEIPNASLIRDVFGSFVSFNATCSNNQFLSKLQPASTKLGTRENTIYETDVYCEDSTHTIAPPVKLITGKAALTMESKQIDSDLFMLILILILVAAVFYTGIKFLPEKNDAGKIKVDPAILSTN